MLHRRELSTKRGSKRRWGLFDAYIQTQFYGADRGNSTKTPINRNLYIDAHGNDIYNDDNSNYEYTQISNSTAAGSHQCWSTEITGSFPKYIDTATTEGKAIVSLHIIVTDFKGNTSITIPKGTKVSTDSNLLYGQLVFQTLDDCTINNLDNAGDVDAIASSGGSRYNIEANCQWEFIQQLPFGVTGTISNSQPGAFGIDNAQTFIAIKDLNQWCYQDAGNNYPLVNFVYLASCRSRYAGIGLLVNKDAQVVVSIPPGITYEGMHGPAFYYRYLVNQCSAKSLVPICGDNGALKMAIKAWKSDLTSGNEKDGYVLGPGTGEYDIYYNFDLLCADGDPNAGFVPNY